MSKAVRRQGKREPPWPARALAEEPDILGVRIDDTVAPF